MPTFNTIARCEAKLPDGSLLVYSDWDQEHVRQARFAAIMAAKPVEFTAVTMDGERFTVDLVSGDLSIGEDRYHPMLPADAVLRLIYYKRMGAVAGGEAVCDYFVVGWQTTLEGKNLKVGLKVDPSKQTWEITEAI